MKIQNITQLTPASTLREKPASERAESTQSASPSAASANVSQLHQPGTDGSQDINALRVEELREAIASGRFEIRADRIAEGLIASLQEHTPTEQP